MIMKYRISFAAPQHIPKVKEIADSLRDELGFTLLPQLEEAMHKSELIVAVNSIQDVLGYTKYHIRRDKNITVYSIGVESKCQGMGVGTALMDFLKLEIDFVDGQVIRLKCPVDLPSNTFYEKMGFKSYGIESGRRRELQKWCYHNPDADFLCGW